METLAPSFQCLICDWTVSPRDLRTPNRKALPWNRRSGNCPPRVGNVRLALGGSFRPKGIERTSLASLKKETEPITVIKDSLDVEVCAGFARDRPHSENRATSKANLI